MEKQKILTKIFYDIASTILVQFAQLKEVLSTDKLLQLKIKLIQEQIKNELAQDRENLKRASGKIQSSLKFNKGDRKGE